MVKWHFIGDQSSLALPLSAWRWGRRLDHNYDHSDARVNVDLNNPSLNGTPAVTPAVNSQNPCPVTRTPDLLGSDTICRILYPIEVPLIPKPINYKKRHNNNFILRARAWPQLWSLRSKGEHWPQQFDQTNYEQHYIFHIRDVNKFVPIYRSSARPNKSFVDVALTQQKCIISHDQEDAWPNRNSVFHWLNCASWQDQLHWLTALFNQMVNNDLLCAIFKLITYYIHRLRPKSLSL